MSVIVADAAFKAKPLAAGREVELWDGNGESLARVTVVAAQPNLKALAEEMEVSEVELTRLPDPNQPTFTTEEVLAHAKDAAAAVRDIVWPPPAHDQFLDIWEAANAAELSAVEQAIQGLYVNRDTAPLAAGESRGGSRRVAVRPPLTVWFEVLDDGRRVRIFHDRRSTGR